MMSESKLVYCSNCDKECPVEEKAIKAWLTINQEPIETEVMAFVCAICKEEVWDEENMTSQLRAIYSAHGISTNSKLETRIEALSEREQEALKAAIAPIYFADNSDYLSGLWNVVHALIGEETLKSLSDVRDCLYALSPELQADAEGEGE